MKDITAAKIAEIKSISERMIEQHGFVVNFVFPVNEDGDWNIHTHGLVDSCEHPELQICLGVPQQIAMTIIHDIVKRIKGGERFEHGQVNDELIHDFSIRFIEVNPKLIRLIMPDKDGKYLESELSGVYKNQYHANPEQFAIVH
jgi:hypothetical protein